MNSVRHFVIFVGDPVTAVLGFTMFCFPEMWAKLNALLSHKNFNLFNSPKQLAHTKRVGILMMVAAVFSLVSVLSLGALMPSK